MGIKPFIALSNISNVFLITLKNVLNLSISCNKKLLIDGKILSSSPNRCYGITDLLIGYGNEENTAIVYRVLSYIETLLPPFGYSN
jgi:hypothetical protein